MMARTDDIGLYTEWEIIRATLPNVKSRLCVVCCAKEVASDEWIEQKGTQEHEACSYIGPLDHDGVRPTDNRNNSRRI